MSDIAKALKKLFKDKHRIVFWYDAKQELISEYEALELAGVEKLELLNNEFALKYRILREQPDQKFLLYHKGPQPPDLDNWLLDVQLAHGEFRTDQVGLWMADLNFGLEFAEVVQTHAEFYTAAKRREALKRSHKPDDTQGIIRLKMLAICADADPRLDSILEHLLAELAENITDKVKLISRCSLTDFLWQQMERTYGYKSDTPGIEDFVIELFKSCYAMETNGTVKLTGDALVFLKRWKDSRRFEQAFETLSERCADVLRIEQDLEKRNLQELVALDYFELVDKKVMSDLVRAIASKTISSGNVTLYIRQRRQGHWYKEFKDLYEAIDYAAQFISALDEASLSMESMTNGIKQYCQSWFRIDQLYRKFTFHVRQSAKPPLMEALTEQIENLYSNNYLLKVNDRWQTLVDAMDKWEVPSIPLQRTFFYRWVQPFLNKGKKVCVIISDAMRYEVGEELTTLIRQEDRYDAEIEAALSMLPSYTQLGMAALLPNQELAITDSKDAAVNVDGISSRGTENRKKILNKAQKATAVLAKDLMKMNRNDSRELFREHAVVYVYHNHIDHTGKRDSAERVFAAAEETLAELIGAVKKLTNANASNIIVTADHGFIYQDKPIPESDFTSCEADGDHIFYRDRRFVLGRGLKEAAGLRKFSSANLGLVGALVPSSGTG
ncbi:MAG: BREX-1 system phosphatase PglZ type A [Phormidesmis priestleyi]|uniref:BREX-1 system phosphatase PglZ type A n=1 Tax=Phormidesmis priestleyi TaxID=268141 RepID=A0A2W4WPB9_9CYAN|nr:MAG: BREX-1 system phosphatase PglZ type A [Phormidesmis priestleyi]